MQIRMSIDAPQVLLPYVPKCTWYFAPLEKRHAPAPRFGAVRAYSQFTYIPRAPAALAMPRCPAGIRPSPYTCLCTLPKPGEFGPTRVASPSKTSPPYVRTKLACPLALSVSVTVSGPIPPATSFSGYSLAIRLVGPPWGTGDGAALPATTAACSDGVSRGSIGIT